MADDSIGEPKLHVDSDWKAQARAEKERLAKGEPSGGAKPQAGAAEPGRAAGRAAGRAMPQATFTMLVQTLAAQAMMFLSPERDPRTGEPLQNLDLAKHSIDLLGILDQKTKGNLTPDEKELLDTALYQTRMAYVQAAR
jgi:hypothetical protein